jgi:hypothetical protein
MVIPAGQEGTVLGTLTVEGEDRVKIEFERPTLELNLDATALAALEWNDTREILDRTQPDLLAPLLRESAHERTPYRPRPWLHRFASGVVARFRPEVQGVESWRLTIANSRGETVTTFEGKGKPPREIPWTGRSADGTPVLPGFTYSHVFDAMDRAGNKRSFVGAGFELPPYVYRTEHDLVLLFSANEANEPEGPRGQAPAIVLEAATWLNDLARLDAPVDIAVTARSFEQASGIARDIQRRLTPLLLGDPARVRAVTEVQPDAAESGTVTIRTTS